MRQTLPLVPYEILETAIAADGDALQVILQRYAPYIRHLAQSVQYDAQGYPHRCIDEQMCSALEHKLICAVLQFELQ